jgi:hypothetical protein
MFRSQLFDHLQGSVFRANAVTTFSASLRRQVVYLVCGCNVVYVCACLMYLSVGCLVVNCLFSDCLINCQFTSKHPTDKYIRHAHT